MSIYFLVKGKTKKKDETPKEDPMTSLWPTDAAREERRKR